MQGEEGQVEEAEAALQVLLWRWVGTVLQNTAEREGKSASPVTLT